MSDCMTFPNNWRKFLRDNSFKDSDKVYTNGVELIPVFRVEQLIEHLLAKQEPRVLTLDEVVHLIGVPRWAEYKVAIPGTNDVMVQAGWVMVIDEQLINREYDEHFVTFADEFGTHKYHVGAYKKGWRCWSAKPTEEQRKAVKWDD